MISQYFLLFSKQCLGVIQYCNVFQDLLLLAHPGSSVVSGSHWAATDIVKDPNSILSKCFQNRHNSLVDFVIGSTTKITVKVYSFFRYVLQLKKKILMLFLFLLGERIISVIDRR